MPDQELGPRSLLSATDTCQPAIPNRYLRTGVTLGPSHFEAGVEESGAPVSLTVLPSGPLDSVSRTNSYPFGVLVHLFWSLTA